MAPPRPRTAWSLTSTHRRALLSPLPSARSRFVLLVLTFALPAKARSQFVASIDASAAHASYDKYLPSAVYTLAPAVLFADNSTRVGLDGIFSKFESGHGSGQVDANGAYNQPIVGLLSAELSGEGSTLWYRRFPTVYSGLAEPKLRFDAARMGAWIGADAGATSGSDNHGVIRGDFGAWYRLPLVVLTTSFTPTNAVGFEYTDINGAVHGEWNRFSATVNVGTRTGDRTGVASWCNAEARVAIIDGVSTIFGGGAYPPDFIRGTPGARFISLSFRMSEAFGVRHHPSDPPMIAAMPPSLRNRRTVRFTAAPGATVEFMADFTGWQPVPMRETSPGIFEATLPLVVTSGAHRVNIRIDGGPWVAPTELPAVADDFGGKAGELVVP